VIAPVNNESNSHLATVTDAGERAGFWVRAGAAIVDGLLIGVFMLPVHVLAIIAYKSLYGLTLHQALTQGAIVVRLINIGLNAIAIYFYFGYFYSADGATPGKKLLGLKVLTSNCHYLSYRRAFLREFVGKALIDVFTIGIGYLLVAFRKDKLALHDLIFETQVIKRKDG
jgi:uncharacterized RDD family membrane protein YckC